MKINTNKFDVIWSYLGYGLNLAINVILLPWILKTVGQAELGIWYTFASVAIIVNTVDFGFSPTILRNLTYAWSGVKALQKTGVQCIENGSEPNYELYKKVLAACKYLYLFISMLALIILVSVGSVYINYISVGFRETALVAWTIYSLGCFMNLFYSYWPLALRSIGRMAEAQKATVVSKAVQFIVSMIGLKIGGGIIALAIAYVVSGLVLRWCAKLYFTREKEVKENIDFRTKDIDFQELFHLLSIIWFNAKKAGISTIATTLMGQSGIIVCSGILGVNTTAEYGLALQLVTVLVGVGQITYQINLPVLTNARVVNDMQRQQRKFSVSVVCYFLITMAGTSFCFLFLGDIIYILKSNTAFNPMLFLGIAIYYIPENNYAIHASYISIGNELPFVKSLVVTALARVALLFLLTDVFYMDVVGIVLAGVISNFSYIVWKWPGVALKQLQLTPIRLIKLGTIEIYKLLLSFFKGGKVDA